MGYGLSRVSAGSAKGGKTAKTNWSVRKGKEIGGGIEVTYLAGSFRQIPRRHGYKCTGTLFSVDQGGGTITFRGRDACYVWQSASFVCIRTEFLLSPAAFVSSNYLRHAKVHNNAMGLQFCSSACRTRDKFPGIPWRVQFLCSTANFTDSTLLLDVIRKAWLLSIS